MSEDDIRQLHPAAFNDALTEISRLEEKNRTISESAQTLLEYQRNAVDNVRLLAHHISSRLLGGRKLDVGGAEAVASLSVDPMLIFTCEPHRFLSLLGVHGGRADYLVDWARGLREASDADA
ncbi:hypothetical protein [Gluconobacter oxydans]|uniref:hypothetical protein n=1 Tax=Gluconobacter oxydans TaxID=442 RepID=UPI003463F867